MSLIVLVKAGFTVIVGKTFEVSEITVGCGFLYCTIEKNHRNTDK